MIQGSELPFAETSGGRVNTRDRCQVGGWKNPAKERKMGGRGGKGLSPSFWSTSIRPR